jgi:hypothetical protein
MEKIALLLTLLSCIVIASKLWGRIDRPRMTEQAAASTWSELDISELRRAFRENLPISDIAGCLLRTEDDVRAKARDLGIALNVS